ncbi:Glycosyltransferase family 61 protein [Acetobacteraceae bacterium EV16G]|uniref:Glycosyltransferase family 61 protein n=1 Tax=Sorlinia euscelidii TaxID=3081148 RepID=A0ABU7U3U3_9PROT
MTAIKKAKFPEHIGINFYSDPEVFTFADAIYVCGYNHFDNLMGVFTREGYLIPQAAFHHQSPSIPKGHPNWTDPAIAASYPAIDAAVFAGHVHDQYGHFITEFISRLWAIKEVRTNEKILVRCARGLDEVFTFKWAIELFDLLGLTKDDFICPDHPIRIRKLIVPAPAFTEQGYCYRRMAEYCHTIGDRAMERLDEQKLLKDKDIYVSRSQLICGTVKIDNEIELERHLRDLDFEIIYPEQLSINEQISLFRNNNIVVGPVGSALHTSIFTPAPCGIALNVKSAVDSNFLMMDGVNEAQIDYIQSDNIVEAEEKDVNYYETKTIRDVESFAQTISDSVREKRNNFYIPNMGRFPLSSHVDVKFYDLLTHEGAIVKLDPRTGYLSSLDDRFFKNLVLATFIDGDRERAFLVSGEEKMVNIVIHDTSLTGLAIPVDIIENEGGTYAFFMPENQRYLQAIPISQGGWVQNKALKILEWERFNLKEKTAFSPKPGSEIARLLSVMAGLMLPDKPFHLDFYLNQIPEVVSHIVNVKNKMEYLRGDDTLIVNHARTAREVETALP